MTPKRMVGPGCLRVRRMAELKGQDRTEDEVGPEGRGRPEGEVAATRGKGGREGALRVG